MNIRGVFTHIYFSVIPGPTKKPKNEEQYNQISQTYSILNQTQNNTHINNNLQHSSQHSRISHTGRHSEVTGVSTQFKGHHENRVPSDPPKNEDTSKENVQKEDIFGENCSSVLKNISTLWINFIIIFNFVIII